MTFVIFLDVKKKNVVNESSIADPEALRTERLLFGSGSEQKPFGTATHLHTIIYILNAKKLAGD